MPVGTTLSEIAEMEAVTLPGYNETVCLMNFSNWSVGEDNYYPEDYNYNYTSLEIITDTVFTAHWTHTITYTDDGGFTDTCTVTVTDKTVAQINEGIDAITADMAEAEDSAAAKTALDNALSDLGGVERLAELASYKKGETLTKLEALEEAYISKANVTVESPKTDENVNAVKDALGVDDTEANKLNVSGAGLNANPGQSVALSVTEVDKDHQAAIDDQKYTNAQQLDLKLTVTTSDNTEPVEIEELKAPVTV